jgi:hypothetical protein
MMYVTDQDSEDTNTQFGGSGRNHIIQSHRAIYESTRGDYFSLVNM